MPAFRRSGESILLRKTTLTASTQRFPCLRFPPGWNFGEPQYGNHSLTTEFRAPVVAPRPKITLIALKPTELLAPQRVATLGLRMVPDTDALESEVESLCAAARWCYSRGWVPATSGNFSFRASGRVLVTASGLDKGTLTPAGLIEVDLDGGVLADAGRPSAETGLHLVLYRNRPTAGAILHVHTIWNTLLSAHYEGAGCVPIEGYELLKGLAGVGTHAYLEQVPILKNAQDYADLSDQLAGALRKYPHAHGVLLSRHGLYTWGESVAEARRHLEALEFLFEVEGRRLLGRQL